MVARVRVGYVHYKPLNSDACEELYYVGSWLMNTCSPVLLPKDLKCNITTLLYNKSQPLATLYSSLNFIEHNIMQFTFKLSTVWSNNCIVFGTSYPICSLYIQNTILYSTRLQKSLDNIPHDVELHPILLDNIKSSSIILPLQ